MSEISDGYKAELEWKTAEIARLTRERDDARDEAATLRRHLNATIKARDEANHRVEELERESADRLTLLRDSRGQCEASGNENRALREIIRRGFHCFMNGRYFQWAFGDKPKDEKLYLAPDETIDAAIREVQDG